MNAVAAWVNLFIASVYDAMDGVAGVLTKISFFHIIGSLICFAISSCSIKGEARHRLADSTGVAMCRLCTNSRQQLLLAHIKQTTHRSRTESDAARALISD